MNTKAVLVILLLLSIPVTGHRDCYPFLQTTSAGFIASR